MSSVDPTVEQVAGIVRRDAFLGLLRGAPMTVSGVAARRQLALGSARVAVDQLVAAGAAEVVGDEKIVGAHGLTTRTTRHAIDLDDHVLHTWCALDAVGIPVALRLDATALTSCPTCAARLTVPIRAGRADRAPFVLWFPTEPCSHLMRDFCSAANLFCDAEHVEAWRGQAGHPQGRIVFLAEAEVIARKTWADVAPNSS